MYDAEHQRIKELLEKSDRPYKVIPVNEDNLTHVFRITERVAAEGVRLLSGRPLPESGETAYLYVYGKSSGLSCRPFSARLTPESARSVLFRHARKGRARIVSTSPWRMRRYAAAARNRSKLCSNST